MAATSANLNYHPQKGYRLQIGFCLTAEGKRTHKVWWFGRIDHTEAESQADLIRGLFQKECPTGFWTEHATEMGKRGIASYRRSYESRLLSATKALEGAGMVVTPGEAPIPTAVKALKKVVPDPPRMLHASLDDFLKHLEQRRDAGDCGEDYVSRTQSSIKSIKRRMPNMPLADVGRDHLETLKLAYQKLLTLPKAKGGRAWATVSTECNMLRAAFRWYADREWWVEPRKWAQAVMPARTAACEDEQDDEEHRHRTYAIAELARLYAHANDDQRLYLLLGLNMAWGQKEIATAKKRHFQQGDGIVRRKRHKKTRNAAPAYGEWTMWPETATMVKKRMAQTPDDEAINPKGRAFLTSNNLELVRRAEYKLDAIADSFRRLCKTAEVENRGFYSLRRECPTRPTLLTELHDWSLYFCRAFSYTNRRFHPENATFLPKGERYEEENICLIHRHDTLPATLDCLSRHSRELRNPPVVEMP